MIHEGEKKRFGDDWIGALVSGHMPHFRGDEISEQESIVEDSVW